MTGRNISASRVNIQNCGGSIWQQTKCLAQLLFPLTVMSAETPLKIAKNAGQLAILIYSFIPSLSACFGVSVSSDVLNILVKLASCATSPKD